MKYDGDEKIIKDALNRIQTPEYDIMLEVQKKIKPSKSPISFKRTIFVPLVVSLCLIFSFSVAAANIPVLNDLLSIVSPDIALMLQPIVMSNEDEGIKMEVLAAMNDDEMAVIYVTMQDLIGDRLDETLDLYNYSLNGARMFNSQIVHYNDTTKTATLRIQANGGEGLNGKKVSFGIDSFLSSRQEFDAVDAGIDLLNIEKVNDPQMISLDMNNIPGGSGNLYEKLKAQGTINVLKTDQLSISLPQIDFMHISNIGYIDGRLHVQVKWIGEGVDDHGYFYFVDTLGNKLDISEASISFGTDESGNTQYGHGYNEYIFDVGKINLKEAKLMGCFVTNGNYTTGNWRTTFKLKSIGEEKQSECNIKFDDWIANRISISPLGITLVGSGEGHDLQRVTVSANMTDGSVQAFDSLRSYREDKEIKLKFTSSLPLDVSMVESVSVNGTVIKFD